MEAARFKEIRCALGFSQAKLARYMGSSVQQIHRWENGKVPVSGTAAVLLTAILTNGENLRFMLQRAERNRP